MAGLSLADLLRLRCQAASTSLRSSAGPKAVIMVVLPGGPSHIDTYDLKPAAPAEYRGEFRPTASNVRDAARIQVVETDVACGNGFGN